MRLIWLNPSVVDSGGPGRQSCHMDAYAEPIRWFASISGMIAATIVSLDWGRRDTGWGMVLFCLSAIAWITGAVLTRDWALGTQNSVLLLIDMLGVYRYLLRDKPPAAADG
ncbi:hypothetical protein [Sphingomonas sp. MA1305]|uniref:hypothetical protein n=1 Tax=Sphingomonas sp. MA1305 TaxID=2479204 RepID=UPI001E55286B|nr:hypothetical protein [Sphingomonas sp. MA1305]